MTYLFITYLFITAPPAFTVENFKEKMVLKEGQSIAIELPFSASPQPKVSWDFNKEPLSTTRRMTIDVIYNMTSMCVGKVNVKDSGNYTVTLSNKHGKVSITFQIVVLGKPSAPQDLKVNKVMENSVTLKWSEPRKDGGSKITGYIIEKRDTSRHTYSQVIIIVEYIYILKKKQFFISSEF